MCCWLHYLSLILEQNLIDTRFLIEYPQRGFESLNREVARAVVKALVIHPADSQYHAGITGFGDEGVFVPEAEQVDVRVQGAGFGECLPSWFQAQHRGSQSSLSEI